MPVGLFVLALSVLGVVAGTLVGRMPWETPSSATAQFRSAQTYRLESGHTYDIYSKVLLLEDACTVTPQGGTGAVLRQDLDLDSAVVQDEALWVPVLTFRVSAAGAAPYGGSSCLPPPPATSTCAGCGGRSPPWRSRSPRWAGSSAGRAGLRWRGISRWCCC